MFRLVANKSTWGLSQSLEISLKICGERDHSVDWIWFLLGRPSAIMLSEPGMCLALSVTLLRAQSSADRVPPCLLI